MGYQNLRLDEAHQGRSKKISRADRLHLAVNRVATAPKIDPFHVRSCLGARHTPELASA